METQQEIALNKNQVLIGTDVNVIVDEKISEEKFIGRTSWDAPEIDNQVILTGKTEVGNIESVRVTGADSYDLIGEVIHSRICQEEKRHNVIGKISCQQKRAEITNYA